MSTTVLNKPPFTRVISTFMSRIANKTILITGASSGIGRSTAIEFAKVDQSIKLIITARRIEKLSELKSELKDSFKGVKVHSAVLDVRNYAEITNLISTLPNDFKDIDILVNNAGMVLGTEKVGQVNFSDIDTMVQTNVVGMFNMTQAVLPILQAKGGRGDIINIGSVAGRDPYPGGSVYCATKAALRAFTESLRKELISTRIRVIEIDPGQVETEFSLVRFRGDRDKADAVYEGVEPLTPQDIAEVIVFAATRRENVVIADVEEPPL